MKVERSKNRLYYLDLDRVDPICDEFLVEEQRSAPFPHESTHVTQDVICERGKSGQPEGSPENGRPPWLEGGGLKENSSPEEAPLKGPQKRKAGYTCMELLNIAVASSRPTRPEGGRAANSQVASSEKSASLTASMEVPRAGGLTSQGRSAQKAVQLDAVLVLFEPGKKREATQLSLHRTGLKHSFQQESSSHVMYGQRL
jgi:hypothetical protein